MTFCSFLMVITGCSLKSNESNSSKIIKPSATDTLKTEGKSNSNNIEKNKNNINDKKFINDNENKVTPKNIDGLVRVKDIDDTIIIDLKYATQDNFTGKIVYPFKTCLLRKETAEKLSKANRQLSESNYRIKIYDGYRPPYAQEIFWNLIGDERFVANPNKGGSIHSRGGAVDVTIVDKNGNELEMPSKFDDFTEKASRKNGTMSVIVCQNLNLLTSAMKENGFDCIDTEWWHYNDIELAKYKILDVNPDLFK